MHIRFLLLVILCLGILSIHRVDAAQEHVLSNTVCSVSYVPETLGVKLQSKDHVIVDVSTPQAGLGKATDVKQTTTNATWALPDHKIVVTLVLDGDRLSAHILAENPGSFTFPIIPETSTSKGWILPMFEGVYAPTGDEKWRTFLINHGELNTTADLTMPFVGLNYGDQTLTYIFTNPFNNELKFEISTNKTFQASLTHRFTRNHPVKEYGVIIQPGKNSLVEPARIYRDWIIQHGQFVSLKDKIARTPEVEKLLGAAHAYLWGGDLLHHTDVLNWKHFADQLKPQQNPTNTAAASIVSHLQSETQKVVASLSKAEWVDNYAKKLITDDLNSLLEKGDFYDEKAWRGISFHDDLSALLKKDSATLTQLELARRNCALLCAAFPNTFADPKTWGNGVSVKMISELKEAGLKHLWLGTDGWRGLINRPEVVDEAKKAGYLIGPYDSYHSIHDPKEKETWETAQFDLALYQTGAIVKADGTTYHGFKKKGFQLSPVAARPYVEKRVTGLMKQFPANSWFIDCDGFGEFYDDYSPAHPATQFSDMQERNARMAWIRDTFGAVIGSEGCSAGVASTIHFAHGVMTPVIGWGDADMNNKQSKYFVGAYYPNDEPKIQFMPIPIKEEYRYIYFEPRFRLPLFQTVFHDSVVATHHWSFASFKTKDLTKTVELMELLYNIPPLYHLNLAEFQKRKAQIKKHYDFFSPLHRELALLPMTDFKWLTPDGTVQQTTFGNKASIIANFGKTPYVHEGATLAEESLLVVGPDSAKTQTYIP